MELECAFCGEPFERTEGAEKRRKTLGQLGPFCSPSCGNRFRAGVTPEQDRRRPADYIGLTGDPEAGERAAKRVAQAIRANRRDGRSADDGRLPHDPSLRVNHLPRWDRCLVLRAGLQLANGEGT